MGSGPPRRRRARPVADAPIDALLPLAEDLAKGWLLALVEQVSLEAAGSILAVDLSRDGPRICQAVLRALVDDADLKRLESGGALTPLAARIGELAGASRPETASGAVDALHAVIWTALRQELRAPDPDLVGELAERLSLVTELLRGAVLRQAQATAEGEPPRGLSAVRAVPAPSPERAEATSGSSADEDPARPARPDDTSAFGAGPDAGLSTPQRPPWVRESAPAEPVQALWIGALQEEIHRAAGAPLSLLLAELEDAERITAVQVGSDAGQAGSEAVRTFGDFAKAVRGVARRQDILVCETEARAWIIARDTGRSGANALGERIAQAVREGRPWREAPLAASVGVAVLGEDGRSPAELIDAAEQARFAAAASGLGVVSPDELEE